MPSMILKELQIENIVNQFQNYTCSVYGLLFESEVTVRNHIEQKNFIKNINNFMVKYSKYNNRIIFMFQIILIILLCKALQLGKQLNM